MHWRTVTKPPAIATSISAVATDQEAGAEQEAAASTAPKTPEIGSYPLAEPGPYAVGKSVYEFVD